MSNPRGAPENLKPARKGEPSRNPGGRPKSQFGAFIREQTGDGKELVEFWLKTLRDRRVKTPYRLESAQQLADRGFGKAIQSVELTGDDGAPIILKWSDGGDA